MSVTYRVFVIVPREQHEVIQDQMPEGARVSHVKIEITENHAGAEVWYYGRNKKTGAQKTRKDITWIPFSEEHARDWLRALLEPTWGLGYMDLEDLLPWTFATSQARRAKAKAKLQAGE